MRRLAAALAVTAAFALPTAPAHAIECGIAQPACYLVCRTTGICPR